MVSEKKVGAVKRWDDSIVFYFIATNIADAPVKLNLIV